ncbi:hypothetical protein DXG01_008520, partial [Tephrocybe rancida]
MEAPLDLFVPGAPVPPPPKHFNTSNLSLYEWLQLPSKEIPTVAANGSSNDVTLTPATKLLFLRKEAPYLKNLVYVPDLVSQLFPRVKELLGNIKAPTGDAWTKFNAPALVITERDSEDWYLTNVLHKCTWAARALWAAQMLKEYGDTLESNEKIYDFMTSTEGLDACPYFLATSGGANQIPDLIYREKVPKTEGNKDQKLADDEEAISSKLHDSTAFAGLHCLKKCVAIELKTDTSLPPHIFHTITGDPQQNAQLLEGYESGYAAQYVWPVNDGKANKKVSQDKLNNSGDLVLAQIWAQHTKHGTRFGEVSTGTYSYYNLKLSGMGVDSTLFWSPQYKCTDSQQALASLTWMLCASGKIDLKGLKLPGVIEDWWNTPNFEGVGLNPGTGFFEVLKKIKERKAKECGRVTPTALTHSPPKM